MTSLIRALLSCALLLFVVACNQPYEPPQVAAEPADEGRAAQDTNGGGGY